MDELVEHRYALGTAEQLRENDPDDLVAVEDIPNVDFGNGGIIAVPKFVGVYQFHRLNHNPDESPEESKLGDFIHRKSDDLLSMLSGRSICSRFGVQDTVNPYLIHVLHEPGIPGDVVRMGLSDNLGRVRVSPIDEAPNFSDKDLGSVYLAVESAVKVLKGDSDEETVDTLNRSVRAIESESSKYGLTREEYALLHSSRKLSDKPSGFSDNPVMLKIISGLLGLD